MKLEQEEEVSQPQIYLELVVGDHYEGAFAIIDGTLHETVDRLPYDGVDVWDWEAAGECCPARGWLPEMQRGLEIALRDRMNAEVKS